jgi:DNA-directed RNA polymerase specialized sigma24 family protein
VPVASGDEPLGADLGTAEGSELAKHPGRLLPHTLDDAHAVMKGRPSDLIALDHAVNDLARLDPQQSRLVELRFFGGRSIEETAEVLGISPATASDTGLQLASGYIGR